MQYVNRLQDFPIPSVPPKAADAAAPVQCPVQYRPQRNVTQPVFRCKERDRYPAVNVRCKGEQTLIFRRRFHLKAHGSYQPQTQYLPRYSSNTVFGERKTHVFC